MKTLSVIDNKLNIGFITCEQLIALQRQHESLYTDYPFSVADNIITEFYNNVQEYDNIYLLLHDNAIDYPDEENIVKTLSLFGVHSYKEVSEWHFYAPTMPDTVKDDSDYRTHFVSAFGHEEYSENQAYVHVIYRDEGEVARIIQSHLRGIIIDDILKDLQ